MTCVGVGVSLRLSSTGGGVRNERRAGQQAAPPAPAALRSRRAAAGAADGARLLGLGPAPLWRYKHAVVKP